MRDLTKRSIDLMRERGYTADRAECRNGRSSRDLFGIWDVLCVKPGETVAIQVTSASNVAARIRKVEDSDAVLDCREAGWTLLCHGWKKVKNRWTLAREVDLS